MTVQRAIPPSLAPVLIELELERPSVVTADYLGRIAVKLSLHTSGERLAIRLRRLGWLLPLRVSGVWEFAPADRAGPLSGGDTFIELRAVYASRPGLRITVGYESAAFLRGLATRQPDREVIVAEEGTPRLVALEEFRRIELTLPDEAYGEVARLPVQTPTGILAAIAIRPDGLIDWPGAAEWLGTLASRTDSGELIHLLSGRSPGAWARGIYLLRVGGNASAADGIARTAPPGRGPFYLGPRRRGGHYDRATEVIDTVIERYMTANQEATE